MHGRLRRRAGLLLAGGALAALALPASSALGADGSLDPSLGEGGLAAITFGDRSRPTQAPMTAVGADGAIWLATALDSGRRFRAAPQSDDGLVVVRMRADGAVDPAFDAGVIAPYGDPPGGPQAPLAVAPRADGGVLVVRGGDGVPGPEVLRFTATGALDAAFSDDGRLVVEAPAGCTAQAGAARRDGSVVLLWACGDGVVKEARLTALTATGTPDTGFGTPWVERDGARLGAPFGLGLNVAVDDAGRAYVAGSYGIQLDPTARSADGAVASGAGVVRVGPDGTVDATYGGPTATVATEPTSGSGAFAATLSVSRDGSRVAFAAFPGQKGMAFGIAQLDAAGRPLEGFGAGGLADVEDDQARGIVDGASPVALGDGRVVAVGGYGTDAATGGSGRVVLRLRADGTLDPAFGADGAVLLGDPSGRSYRTGAPVLQDDGSLLLPVSVAAAFDELRAAAPAGVSSLGVFRLLAVGPARPVPSPPAPPADPQPPVATPPSVTIPSVTAPPPARTCVSRRYFPIRLGKGLGPGPRQRIVAATVTVGDRRIKVSRRDRVRRQVDLRGLPRGTFRLEIRLRLASGKRIRDVRTYRTCRW